MDRGNTLETQYAKPFALLVIAGSDSSGGAGLQRDLLVAADHQVEARVAITAVTAQCAKRVRVVHHVPPAIIREQITAANSDLRVGAIKLGMLGTRGAIEEITKTLLELPRAPIVLDPVLAASSGASLLSDSGLTAMLERLCPMIALLTPNLPEAAILLGAPLAKSDDDVAEQAKRLSTNLGCAVLLKGGHSSATHAVDYLAQASRVTAISGQRYHSSMRGTGCALSTAIAIHLSCGASLEHACRAAKAYVASLLAKRTTSPRTSPRTSPQTSRLRLRQPTPCDEAQDKGRP